MYENPSRGSRDPLSMHEISPRRARDSADLDADAEDGSPHGGADSENSDDRPRRADGGGQPKPPLFARISQDELLQTKMLVVCFCMCLVAGTIAGLVFSEEITNKDLLDGSPATSSPLANASDRNASSPEEALSPHAAPTDAPRKKKANDVHVSPLLAFSLIAFFLLLGTVLRMRVSCFVHTFMPASVIGGFSLLGFGQFWHLCGGTEEFTIVNDAWREVPPFAINIVFATMFLGRQISGPVETWHMCNSQFLYGQLLGWGQYVVGLSWGTLLAVWFDCRRIFGVVLPVGFEGGYSVALGLEESFLNADWQDGADLAVAAATTGLLSSTLMGIAMLNWHHRRHAMIQQPFAFTADEGDRFTQTETGCLEMCEIRPSPMSPTAAQRDRLREERLHEMKTMMFFPADRRMPSTYAVVQPGMIDNLSWHICLTALAVFFGYTTKSVLSTLDPSIDSLTGIPQFFRSFPTFPFSLLGGLLIQLVMQKCDMMHMLDRHTLDRLQRMSLDFLIVSAIAGVHTGGLPGYIGPFALLMLAGLIYHFCMAMFFAPYFFGNDHWFERAIVEMGQSMGDTSTGLLLLGIVDPADHTGVGKNFAYSRLLYEPILGGGVWTSLVIPLSCKWGPGVLLGISVVAWLGFFQLWRSHVQPLKSDQATIDRLDRLR